MDQPPTTPEGLPTLDLRTAEHPWDGPRVTAGARRRRRLLTAGLVAGVAVLVTAVALCAYLWLVAVRADDRAAYLDGALTKARADLDTSQSALAAARTQLQQAKDQVAQVAGEKAKAEDQIAAQAKADALFTAANDATTQCANKVIEITRLPAGASRATFDRLSSQLQSLCSQADAANSTLRTFLDKPNG